MSAAPVSCRRSAWPLALVTAALLLAGSGLARAQCAGAGDLRLLATSIHGTFDCARHRLTIPGFACTPTAPPGCATDVVDDLGRLAGTDAAFTAGDASGLAPQLRCQRRLLRAVGRYAQQRVRAASVGEVARRADAHAARQLNAVVSRCQVPVATTLDASPVPRVGLACAGLVPAVGGVVPAREVRDCLERTLRARLERVLRPTIRPNVIVIVSDDQPAWTMDALPTVGSALAGNGLTFTEATPQAALCAPSRASILTGRYVQNHGVFWNLPPLNAVAFDDSSTVATWLHDAGYRTGLIGKYMNGYEGFGPYVPPGWDTWQAFVNPGYFNYQLVGEDGQITSYGSTAAEYSTDVLTAKAVEFIRSAGNRPFLLYFAPFAPHGPPVPAPRHLGAFAGMPPWRPGSYNEADVSDKPAWVRALPLLTPDKQQEIDLYTEGILEMLLSLDEGIAAILAALEETGQADNTFVAFTTDNGFELGEHRFFAKDDPYEGSVHVPLVVRYPRMGPQPPTSASFVSGVDLAPTFAELAGVTPSITVDGKSLLGLLDGTGTGTWRQDVLIESWPQAPATQHMVVRWGKWKYVEYRGSLFFPIEVELYDLDADPDELTSVHADPANAAVRLQLATRLRELCPLWMQALP